MPADGICREQVGKKLSDDSESVGLKAMDGVIIVHEVLFEELTPHAVELTQPLTNHTVELFICPLLAGAFNDHRS